MSLHLLLAENSLFKAVGDVFHPLFVAVSAVLAFIYGIVHDYAASIVILTIVIMALLTPLTIKSTRSMIAMQALQPEMQKLRAKYKGAENREQLNQEMMRLYRENNVSPTGGCLPMFLQMPALIVLYDIIRGLANTVKKGAILATGKVKCHKLLCATPKYIPHSSAMYKNLVSTPGVMKSLGLNLTAKPLSSHANWYDYIPYIALVLVAVALQYFQMAQMTKRNRKSNTQVPQQMQTMQRIMPLIFAYIYFLVPAGVVIYMIVSSAIRVGTQDVIFRYGIVQGPGERRIGAGNSGGVISARSSAKTATEPALPEASENGEARARGGMSRSSGTQRGGARRQARTNGSAAAPVPKAHPRSKSKRARKAR